MTSAVIAKRRLLHQRIAGPRCRHPEDVVRWMGALQAHDYQQALWAVGLRMCAPSLDSTPSEVALMAQAWASRKRPSRPARER
jgi:hypothetical protein